MAKDQAKLEEGHMTGSHIVSVDSLLKQSFPKNVKSCGKSIFKGRFTCISHRQSCKKLCVL